MEQRRSKPASEDIQSEESSPTLIPEHIVDPASQRIFIVSIFVVIQCWKIFDILLVKADAYALASALKVDNPLDVTFTSLNNFTFVIKYVVIDGLFLWSLPMFNVPLLSFGPFLTLLLTVLANVFTFVLASDSALPFLSGLVVPVWNLVFKHKELTIMGDSVTPQSVIDMSAHFKGKYTIQFLPASSVQLNPFNYHDLCLDTRLELSSYPIRVPIEFNTTSDIVELQLQHVSPSNSMTLVNYTSHEISKLLKRDHTHLHKLPGYVLHDERVFYLEVDINKPGKYRIHKVTDSNGMNIRPYKSDFTIGHCPSAKFVYPGAELEYKTSKCVVKNSFILADWLMPLLSTFGVFPLNVEIVTLLNSKQVSRFNATITGDEGHGLNWLLSLEITRNSLEQQLLRDSSGFRITDAGKFKFHIASVTDHLGIKRDYNPASSDSEIDFTIDLKESVSLLLVDRHPDNALLQGQTKTLHLETKQRLQLPLSVVIEFEDANHTKHNISRTFRDAEEFHRGITIEQPGKYSIISGEDKFCPCKFDKSAFVPITTPQPPTVNIVGEAIADKCVGTVGYEFDVKFTGKAPFELLYEVFKNLSGFLKPILSERGLRQHLKRSMDTNLRFQYKPRQEGNYVLVFKSIKDVNYHKTAVKILEAENTFSTYFHQKSRYTLFKDSQQTHQDIKVCKGGAFVAPVHFEGNFPFLFTYEIVNTNTGKAIDSKKIKEYFQDSYIVSSPNLDKGGEFEVVIKDVTDKLGCPVSTLRKESISVKARTDIPHALFEKAKSYTIVEGDSLNLPISVKSSVGTSSSDKLEFTFFDEDTNSEKSSVLTGSNSLRVSKKGTYKLKSYENQGCEGTVDNQKSVHVAYYPRPEMKIIPKESFTAEPATKSQIKLKSICQEAPMSIELKLQGQAPFVVTYSIRYPHGKTKSSSMVIESNEIDIPMTTKRQGVYEHIFTGVYDSRYTQDKLRKLNHQVSFPLITYEVLGSPQLQVQKTHLQFCENQLANNKDLSASIPLNLQGAAPFTIQGTVRKMNSDLIEKFEVSGVSGSEVSLGDLNLSKSFTSFFSVGDYLIEFDSITDSNSCRHTQLTSHNSARISVSQVPSIQKQKIKKHYCVGDHISYNMSGVSPFTVFYKFNGQTRKAEQGHEFSRLASKPGELAIVALKDSSASSCLVNYTNSPIEYEELKLEVRDLPSVEISHGDSIIKNLQEGDQTEITFIFTGTPPFQVTYVRTLGDEDSLRKKRRNHKTQPKTARRIVDKKTVKDIWDYEYTEIVGLEGTYEAIMVADAYCRASRDVNEIL